MDNRPIGIFDSGVGGLTIFQSIKTLLPNENFVFLADQKNVPYGSKTQEELVMLTEKIVKFLMSCDVKMIVVACNTATVYTIDHLRTLVDIPIVGTVPVVKMASLKTKTKKAAVFSTPATAKSEYLQALIKKFAGDVQFYTVGGTHLEDLVEKGDLDNPEIESVIRKSLCPLIEKGVDVVALGCTHYPFLKNNIKDIVGDKVLLLDSGGAIARRVGYLLEKENLLSDGRKNDYYYTTGDAEEFRRVTEKLLGKKLDNIEKAEI